MTVTVTIPTATSIKMRFPEFADVDDAVIEFAIEEARLGVGTNWTVNYNIAIVYLTAHFIAAAQQAADDAEGDSGEIASESIGRLKISYKKTAASDVVSTDTKSSTYGKRYEFYRDQNFGGPVVI